MLRTLFSPLIELVLPPRRTEVLVRELSMNTLRSIAAQSTDGTLPYHDPRVTALMWEIKYYGNSRATACGAEILSDLLLDCAQEALGTPILIPIPMHEVRRKERGFNHTETLCVRTLKDTHQFFEYTPRALVRVRNTPRQQGLTRDARLRNIEHSMLADTDMVRGRTCVVVDDVTTTGATFAEAKRALLSEGASSVLYVALARS